MIRKLLASAGLLFAFFLAAPMPVFAVDVSGPPCVGQAAKDSTYCEAAQDPQTPTNNSIYGPNGVITKATNLLAVIVGIAAIIMIIIGGLRYVTSSGDPQNTTNAKNAILAAIIGLVIAVLARSIVIFVLNRL